MPRRAERTRRALLCAGLLALALVAGPSLAHADDPRPPSPSPVEGTKQWQKLSPEERERLHQRWQQFQSLPPQRKEELRQRATEFRKLPPEERARVRQNFDRWQKLSPEDKARVREKFQRFQQLPPDQKQKIRERLKREDPGKGKGPRPP
ncbi:MAG TPA: DUF3106 domain-containing protein [Myxococcota bacterium]|nr:DUF3106 domain-containing protein [Myxococcota bacterium]